MRIMFMGTPEFAVPSLEAVAARHEVCAVITQPDKPVGRRFALTAPPVKVAAGRLGLSVHQPGGLRGEEFAALLRQAAPELIVVVAYGKLLPPAVLEYPRHGCVNVHASLLPKYRGAAPINWAIARGETVTGVTTMYMAEGLDTGDMIMKRETPIYDSETAGDLHDRLMILGAQLLTETLDAISRGEARRVPQDDAQATHAPILSKQSGLIDWGKSARDVINLIRGMCPWPVAYTTLKGERVQIYSAAVGDGWDARPGAVRVSGDGRMEVRCGDGAIVISEMKAAGGRRMGSHEYLQGHRLPDDAVLGASEA